VTTRLCRCRPNILEGTYCNAAISLIDISTSTPAKRGHPLLIGSHAPGFETGSDRLGRLPGQPGPKRDLCLPDRGVRPGAWWTAEGREVDRARRALRSQRLEISDREDPFAAVIRCTADPSKADKRTRGKWSRVMRYAAVYKSDSEALDQFVRRKGGINTCSARFTRNRRKANIERD
jgi:hypothetical protein